ncbi:hypothetical protein V7200_10070 [Cytobacillus firmus]|uniref:Uncharacterized protein n=1 Tax=Cytobacillus firmus TaxID=1399 RepID=A0A800MXH5_CYTFI|nr:hypothetical protein [Cytobacillus firmus]KAF0824283.1 hypothetical protein KIS1582_1962 [Cytobacillus firmus]
MLKLKKLIFCLLTVTTLAIGSTGNYADASAQAVAGDTVNDLPYEH